jgi:hypothetical protein
MTTLLEKKAFVLVKNSHLYRVPNRYKASGTNVVEHLYQARYPVQMLVFLFYVYLFSNVLV